MSCEACESAFGKSSQLPSLVLENKHREHSTHLQTRLKLNKHDFMNLPKTQRRLLRAAVSFEIGPCLKLERLSFLATLIIAPLLARNIANFNFIIC